MNKIKNAINSIRNTVNSICSDVGLSQNFRRLDNTMSIYDNFLGRPIGIVGKNYNFIRSTLKRNIGSGLYGFDGYGTPISSLSNPYYNSNIEPWFFHDSKKNIYSNYMDYMNGVFFDGFMEIPNFSSQEEKTLYFNYNSLLLENNKVGVIRNYDLTDNLLASKLLANGVQSNPNSYTDSRLGIVNNFYLNATLQNSFFYEINRTNNITNDVYRSFGLLGELGMVNGEFTLNNNRVIPQNALTDQFILYTPIGGEFGNRDNILSSTDIINASNFNTQQFIYKSLLGYDLLTTHEVSFSDNDVTDYSYFTKKKYSPRKNQDYLSKIGAIVGYDNDIDDEIIRYNISEQGNGHSTTEHIIYTYAETEGNRKGSVFTGTLGNTWNEGTNYGSYSAYNQIFDAYGEKKDIISYTNKCFELGKYGTLIGRFHTNDYTSEKDAKVFKDMLSSAISKYGMSHGRNLLKKEPEKDNNVNGYTDPYCRVWTFHKQYSKLENLIRPLYGNDKLDQTIITQYQFNRSRLEKYGVKDKTNRLVKFTPNREDSSIKNCMFSIENLAWKYEKFNGHENQKGPLGGRIMWFPPYGLSFSENVNVGWNPTQFIGRGENIYTYTNTERSGNLSFKLLIDHPSLLNDWREGGGENGSVDDVNSVEQKILRFFAGCEILEQKKEEKKPKTIPKPQLPKNPKPSPIYVKHKESSSVYFYVFFPNDYSGVDDNVNGKVKPLDYISNGILCQKDDNGNDIGTSYGFNGLGYEMGKSSGISSGITSSGTVTSDGVTFGTYTYNNKNGKKNYWGYRIDKEYANEVFRNSKSYYDTTDYGLNSKKGYGQLVNYHTDAKSIPDNNGVLFSFADILCTLDETAKNSLNGLYDENNIQIFAQLLNEYDILSVEVNGYASSHGYVSNNNDLNYNRAQTVINWLNKCNPTKFTKSKCKINKTGIGSKLNHNDASSIDAKIWRCVKVIINFEKEELIEQQNATIQSDTVTKVGTNENKENQILSDELTTVGSVSTSSEINQKLTEANNKLIDANNESDTSSVNANESKGYGDEYKFFDRIAKENAFLRNKIVDKIKYFDPAYHSITPEGFNSRLTFLHQCTRQGNTLSASDTAYNRTASNLSFGAPPICVLRIGDFYNTKIIIESLQINFEETTWDLNDEGIGVMPMIADISLGFKFLGGSDLSGPITRLQNAVSFNYYANTTVYDDRSELIEYDENGKIINFKSQE